jgi:hypothetical protein
MMMYPEHQSVRDASDLEYTRIISDALSSYLPSELVSITTAYTNPIKLYGDKAIHAKIRMMTQIVYSKPYRATHIKGVVRNILKGVNGLIALKGHYNPGKGNGWVSAPRHEYISPFHSAFELQGQRGVELYIPNKEGWFSIRRR